MRQPEITYEDFLNKLRDSTEEKRVIALLDNHGENFFNLLLGIVDILTAEKKYFEAEKILKVLADAFKESEFYSALALSQKKQKKFKEAKSNYEKSLAIDSSLFKIYYNYGILLFEMKEFEEAVEAFEQSIALNPEFEECYYNLGGCYRETEEFEKAKEAYENALSIKPDFEDAFYNLGVVEEYLGERNEALINYNRAININGNNIQAHWNKSLLLLQSGNYKEGFKEYEWRLLKKEFKRIFPFPVWKGEDLNHKKILVYCEQGLGDAIQFIRFIKLLNAGSVAVECRKEMEPLFKPLEFIDEVIPRGSRIYEENDFDFTVSIMSLPYLLKVDSENISGGKYITADETKSGKWKEKINSPHKFKVGLSWAGNPEHQNDKYRSIDPGLLLQNLKNEKIEIYSLQLNINDETRNTIENYGVIDLTENIKDFSDTAAFINNLDLVICVDTSLAHLAGAMGKDTWLPLPFNPDWRWLLNRNDSPWYSSVKLFRQKNKNDWTEVLLNVNLDLDARLNSKYTSEDKNKNLQFEKIYSEIENHINNNEMDDALKKLEFALTGDPLPYKAFNYLGILFGKTRNYAKAEEYFLKTLNIKPDFTDAVSNLGIICFEQNRFEDSIALHKKSIELNGGNSESYFNLAYAYQEFGEIERAKENYEKAIELNPGFADAQFNLALLKLLMGKYEQTWPDYNKWAFQSGNRTIRNIDKPEWTGGNFEGKKLYVYPDQGMGDVIQLVRYLPFVKELGGEVIFECQPALFDLLKSITGFDKILKTKPDLEITEEYDLHIPLQNLPGIFNTGLETIPCYSPSIKVSDEANQKWKSKIGNSKNYKIGFVWTGNPYPPINRKRHANLIKFISLFELKEIDFYSLQIGDESDQLKHYKERFNIFDFTNEIENFEDTAALINNLDLIITIDTSVAHLAGAMGKKTFTLLPFIPDWRWGLNSESTPWYPSMKLFRQKERGNWDKAISYIIKELQEIKKGF